MLTQDLIWRVKYLVQVLRIHFTPSPKGQDMSTIIYKREKCVLKIGDLSKGPIMANLLL